MTEWFNQRFIAREQHQQIVDYYRKQVARLYHDLCELRALIEVRAVDDVIETRVPEMQAPFREPPPADARDNVIQIDFRRPR